MPLNADALLVELFNSTERPSRHALLGT